ncbi:MAG: hypothetical protein NVSMB31_14020 [Vulcanimicrobiaceae bacterium]
MPMPWHTKMVFCGYDEDILRMNDERVEVADDERIDITEIEAGVKAVADIFRAPGPKPTTAQIVKAVLLSGRATRNRRLSIPAPLTLADIVPEKWPAVGSIVFVVSDDLQVVPGRVKKYVSGMRVNLWHPQQETHGVPLMNNRSWFDVSDVFSTMVHAHLYAAHLWEDTRMQTMEALLENERDRDIHLTAANAIDEMPEKVFSIGVGVDPKLKPGEWYLANPADIRKVP